MSRAVPSPSPAPASPRAIWLCGAVIVVLAFSLYAGALSGPFLFDDVPGIVENESIRDLGHLARVLHPPATGSGVDSRPVINLSLALNYAVSGLDPRGYRLTNVALHALTALTLFGLLRRTLSAPAVPRRWRELALPVAAGTAFLWTAHPLQTETVICVVQRTEGIVSLWYLLALYCFVRGATPEMKRGWLSAAWISCLLGMASKEVMVSAPLMILLYDRTFLAGTFREAWRRRGHWHLAFGATWILLAWLVHDSGGQRGGTAGFAAGVSPWTYLLTQARALTVYLKLSVWPSPLIADYGDWLASGLREVWAEGTMILMLLVVTFWASVRRPVLGFVGAFFFAVLAPSSSFYPLVSQTIAEHRMYLPLAAVLVLLVAGLFLLPRMAAIVTGVALLAASSALTVQRQGVFRSEEALWQDVIAHAPRNAWAYFNLGKVRYREGRWSEAEQQNRRASEISPQHFGAIFALGLALERQGRVAEAREAYARVLTIRPSHTEANFRLGLAHLRLGQPADALPHFEAVVRLQPDRADAEGNLGAALSQLGRPDEAIPHFERVLSLRPEDADAHLNLALVLQQAGRDAEALTHLETAQRLRPGDAQIRQILESARSRRDVPRR